MEQERETKKDVGAIRLDPKSLPPMSQFDTPSKEQLETAIANAKSKQDLLIISDMMSVIGYSKDGLMAQKLRKRMEEMDNG